MGRLSKLSKHDDLMNSHRFCMDEETSFEINDADAYYLGKCMVAVRQDVLTNALYHEGRGIFYDLAGGIK